MRPADHRATRSPRAPRVVACAVAALLGLGIAGAGGPAQAAPSPAERHHRIEHEGSGQVLRALGRLDRRLDRATRAKRLAPLSDADRSALRDNVAADHAAVEAAATSYSFTPTRHTLTAARRLLSGFHARRYVAATHLLHRSERLAVQIAALEELVAPGSTDGTALDTASALLSRVAASGFRAGSSTRRMQTARDAVVRARALVGQVRADLASA